MVEYILLRLKLIRSKNEDVHLRCTFTQFIGSKRLKLYNSFKIDDISDKSIRSSL